MTDDAEIIQRTRTVIGPEHEHLTDDEVRQTAMYAVVRFNLACTAFAHAWLTGVAERMERITRAIQRDEDPT